MRLVLTAVIALLVSVTAAPAPQGQHTLATSDTLTWVEPPRVTVLSGTFFVGMGEKFDQGSGRELPVGGFVSVPATHRHFAWAGDQETIVQVHGVGPTDTTFVNPADDPRKT